jgi:7-keto-8-aminopelargonate synthetase-like enzyme
MVPLAVTQTLKPHFLVLFVDAVVCRAPLCRKMIVVEGVYANSGDVAPLQQLYRLKEAYK